MEPVTALQVVEIFKKIYDEEFGGRKRGRFRISRELVRKISGRKRLDSRFIEQVTEEGYEQDLIIINREDFFNVIEDRVMDSHRKVPKRIASRFFNQLKQDLSIDEDEME